MWYPQVIRRKLRHFLKAVYKSFISFKEMGFNCFPSTRKVLIFLCLISTHATDVVDRIRVSLEIDQRGKSWSVSLSLVSSKKCIFTHVNILYITVYIWFYQIYLFLF